MTYPFSSRVLILRSPAISTSSFPYENAKDPSWPGSSQVFGVSWSIEYFSRWARRESLVHSRHYSYPKLMYIYMYIWAWSARRNNSDGYFVEHISSMLSIIPCIERSPRGWPLTRMNSTWPDLTIQIQTPHTFFPPPEKYRKNGPVNSCSPTNEAAAGTWQGGITVVVLTFLASE